VASVVKPDGRSHVLVRYCEFVDNDGTPLVEQVPIERLRLPPPPSPAGWVPVLGEQVEGLWNDCWWEGSVREFHMYKGILFQYDRWHANWLWLPLRCARPRPSFWLYYPIRGSADDEEEDKEEEDGVRPPGSCGQAGCQLPDGHMGLCQVKVQGSRRQAVKERAMVQEQLQRYHEIQTSKEIQAQVAIARADVLKKAEDSGVIIKAPRGNRSQWHANFKVDEFVAAATDVAVAQRDESGALVLRGALVIGPGHTVADGCKMLFTELQMGPTAGWWELHAVAPSGEVLADLSHQPPSAELLPLLPKDSYLLVGNCLPPRLLPDEVSVLVPAPTPAAGD